MLKVLMVTSEAEPFAKSGGLGDVLGALPKALVKKGVDCRVIMPKYMIIKEQYTSQMVYKTNITIKVGWRNQYCGIFEMTKDGVTYYFIDNEYYFGGESIYRWDDMERYIFFQKAALEILQVVDFRPDVINCHDWQSGLIPVLLDAHYKKGDFYKDIKTVITIHNLKYQGVFGKKDANSMLELPEYYFTPDKIEYFGDINFLKAGLVYADFITTVSSSYSEEIKQPYFGENLDGLLNAKSSKLCGIVNGIDYDVYSPNNDKSIFYKYNARNFATGKAQNKLALQEQLGLTMNKNIPIIGLISRLFDQKGLDLIAGVMDDIVKMDMQFVILGTGDSKYEELFRHYATTHSDKVSANIMFDNTLAHRIYAASDMFLMPSLYEPCGLSQIISLSYGTLPIVREVGGLKDTIQSFNEFTGEGNGFSFWAYNAQDMLFTIKRALHFYTESKVWNKIVRTAMKCDYSWDASADSYISVYNQLRG